MSISVFNLKYWLNMISGKSINHVEQNLGKHISAVGKPEGYYNDLTQKVLLGEETLADGIPMVETPSGRVYFPTAIFQYGLGAYDLYLDTKENRYLEKAVRCAEWAVEKQEENGAWNNFFFEFPEHPYCAMAQGEACSLLSRMYLATGEEKYKNAAKKAVDFMLLPLEDGGTTEYSDKDIILKEYTHLDTVMNGWIFALWGLYDWILLTDDNGSYREAYNKTLKTLLRYMPRFTNKYWSMYDLGGKIASPFYHNLHIAQMKAMYILTGETLFNEYAERWERNQKSFLGSKAAFIKKAIQKVLEK